MGKRSGITKGGRVMNPADRERKQMRAKELKRNKKQRNAVRQAMVKSRDPDELIEQMSRLDEQEFDPQRVLSLNVIQEKRNKLRASYFQIINLCRQEKEEKKVKNLERMLYEYEVERARKEENFRAMLFSQSENFEEIPLPTGASAPDAANTPYSVNSIHGMGFGPQMPQSAMKVGILKKPVSSAIRKKHKYPPGPPPGLPPHLYASEDEEEDEYDEEEESYREEGRRRRRVRFGNRPLKDAFDEAAEHVDGDENYEDEDYAPVEIPESMLSSEEPPMQHQQPIYSRSAPSLAAPAIGTGPIMPGMALPHSNYPPGYPIMIPSHGMREVVVRSQHGRHSQHQSSAQQSKTGLVSGYSDAVVISAEPQVVKHKTDAPPSNVETTITAGPQMRNVTKETTRFVPTAVKIQRPVVPTVIGPKIPTSSVAGPTKLLPRSSQIKPTQKQTTAVNSAIDATKSVDEACDDFLKELEGLL
uniref:WW domain-binding protein 11 n=1 Tax=Meloidogyne incognita TaxID=6306 RepID=A0A914MAM1_MELIC